MKKNITLPQKYRSLTLDEIETLDGGVGYKELWEFLVRVLGYDHSIGLLDYAGEKTYTALLNAVKKMANPTYQRWIGELNRHQYCCAGNGIGKGCPGR